MLFGLCNAPAIFQRCMMSIFSDFITKIMKVFMADFTIYGDWFDEFLVTLVLRQCIETNLVLNFEKCHFMVEHGVVLGHVVFANGLEVNKAKVKIIQSLPYPRTIREVKSFLGHVDFIVDLSKTFLKLLLLCVICLLRMLVLILMKIV